MTQRDRQVFDESVDKADGAPLGLVGSGSAEDWQRRRGLYVPQFRIRLKDGTLVTFATIDEAREVQYVLNGLSLEGKL